MAGSGGDFFADLTTTPIFDDAVYFTEALLLSSAENEDHLDAQLAMAAELSDIEQPWKILHPEPAPPAVLAHTSAMSFQSEHRSSLSIRSHETQSTGYTSQHSPRTSHERPTADRRFLPSLSRISISTEPSSYLVANQSPRSSPQQTSSTSSFSAVNAVFAPTRPLMMRKTKRASVFLSKFKRTSSTGTSKSHRESRLGEEVDIVISDKSSSFSSPDVDSLRDSGYSEDGASSLDLPRGSEIEPVILCTFLSGPEGMENAQEKPIKIDPMECGNFTSLRNEQREQYQRISLFESNQRKALAVHHHWTLKHLKARTADLKAQARTRHPIQLDRLDEFQLHAEQELHKTQASETQSVAIALRHMTAYCSGVSSIDPSLTHRVTDEDRKKLENQRLLQQKLPEKHKSQINVLRARQERDTKNRLERQARELEQLDTDLVRATKEETAHYVKELARLEAIMAARRKRVMSRWNLKYEMWRKEWEKQNQDALPGRIPQEDWPEESSSGSGSLIPDTSALAVYNDALTGLLMELGDLSLESPIVRGHESLKTTLYF